MSKQNNNNEAGEDKALAAINNFQQSCFDLVEQVNEKLFNGDRPGGYWVGNEVGGTYDFGDTDFLTPEEMMLILLHHMTYEDYSAWREGNLNDTEHYINLRSWLMGARHEMFGNNPADGVADKADKPSDKPEADNSINLDELSAKVEMSREEFKKLLKEYDNAADFIGYVRGLGDDLQTDFEQAMSKIRDILHQFQQDHPQQLTTMALYHIEGNPYSHQPGKGETMHCLTNVFDHEDDEQGRAHIIQILFQNCKMSRAFRDMIVGTYLCCKKAGIADGMYSTVGEATTSAPPAQQRAAKRKFKSKTNSKKNKQGD